jgi:hypothetical protein
MRLWARTRVRARRSATFGTFRMKPINVWPMLILLIVIVLLVIYLRPH